MNIGEFLEKTRCLYGLSKTDVAKNLNVLTPFYYDLEKGNKHITKYSLLDKICDFYKIGFDEKITLLKETSKQRLLENSVEDVYMKFLEDRVDLLEKRIKIYESVKVE